MAPSPAEHVLESEGPERTREFGRRLGAALSVGDCVALRGPLGAGKTTFAQGALAGAGATGTGRSPTYALVHEHGGRVPLRHLDVYRLEGSADFAAIGGVELFDGVAAIVEWPERIEADLPEDRLDVSIEWVAGAPERRRIRLRPTGPRGRELAGAVLQGDGG